MLEKLLSYDINNNNNNNNNNKNNHKILLTIKFRSKKLSSESTIYNSFRLKKHLILILKTHFNSKKLFELKNNLFQLKKTITSIFKKNLFAKVS